MGERERREEEEVVVKGARGRGEVMNVMECQESRHLTFLQYSRGVCRRKTCWGLLLRCVGEIKVR